jgi:hypothetical protein
MTKVDAAKLNIARFIREDCYNDPALLSEVILRGQPLWSGREFGIDGQMEWCRYLVEYRSLCLITGHSMGKSMAVGEVFIPWFALTRPNSLVLVYAPSYSAILNNLWRGLHNAFFGAYLPDGSFRKPAIEIAARFRHGGVGNPTCTLPNGSQIIALSSDKVERLQGIRRPETMIVTEESSGLPDYYWQAIRSINAVKLIHIGNPLTKHCEFYNLYSQGLKYQGPPHLGVKTIQLSSLDSPHAHLDQSPWGLASRMLIEDYKRSYGENSPEYRARVLGQWPSDDYEDLLDLATLDRCLSPATREYADARRKRDPHARRFLSCDVGLGKGDSKTVITVRDDYGVLEMIASQMLIEEAAQRISRVAAEYGVEHHNIVYDGSGDSGSRLQAALHALGMGAAWPYYGGDTSDVAWGKGYFNARASIAYAFANRISRESDPFHIPGDLDCLKPLLEELRGLRAIYRGDGKSALEDRDALKKRLRRSPDHADSLLMSFAYAAKRG